jgi:ketosteroid isomerase-like protein
MRRILIVCLFVVFLSGSALAGEWSAEQKEVWKNVEAYWAVLAKGDADGFMSYVHADYRGWGYQSGVPVGKSSLAKFVTHGAKTETTYVHDLQPLTVYVQGDFAYVHYYYTEIVKDAAGKQEGRSGRWTDILTKQGDKWVLIGDHGGQKSDD